MTATADYKPITNNPAPVLDDEALYYTDNGAVYHGRCCGSSARYTGRDISGQRVDRVTLADFAAAKSEGWPIECEDCRADRTVVK